MQWTAHMLHTPLPAGDADDAATVIDGVGDGDTMETEPSLSPLGTVPTEQSARMRKRAMAQDINYRRFPACGEPRPLQPNLLAAAVVQAMQRTGEADEAMRQAAIARWTRDATQVSGET